jgi:hypothetical protein
MLEKLRKISIDLSIVLILTVVTWSIVSEVWNGVYSIDPILVPGQVDQSVQDGTGVALALQAEVGDLLAESRTGSQIRTVIPETNQPDLTVAGTNVPLRYFASLIRDLIGLPYKRIIGELSPTKETADRRRCLGTFEGLPRSEAQTDQSFHLILQLADSSATPFFDCTGSYSELIHDGGLAVLSIVDPYTSATLLSKLGDDQAQVEAHLLVLDALAEAKQNEVPAWLQRSAPLWRSVIPRAHLALGNIDLDEGDPAAAIEEFNQADSEFAERDVWRRHWFAAMDGISAAYIALGAKDAAKDGGYFESARQLAQEALRLNGTFDSALYHLAQSYDGQSAEFLRTKKGVNCDVTKNYNLAVEAYQNLLSQYPKFAIGYTQQGVLMLQMLTYANKTGSDGCEDIEELKTLDRDIDNAFSNATSVDPDGYYLAWFQWGILRLIEEGGLGLRPTVEEQKRLLDDAVPKLEKASELQSSYFGIWDQLGKARAQRLLLGGLPDPVSYREHAKEVLCKAIALARQPDDRERNVSFLHGMSYSVADCKTS